MVVVPNLMVVPPPSQLWGQTPGEKKAELVVPRPLG